MGSIFNCLTLETTSFLYDLFIIFTVEITFYLLTTILKMGISLNQKQSFLLLAFLNNSYHDYLAARVLINNKLLMQGAILGHTSFEKAFKSIIIFKMVENGCNDDNMIDPKKLLKHLKHNTIKLLHEISKYDPKLYNLIDRIFLEELNKCYEFRYIESISNDFKITLKKSELLYNLDKTFNLLFNKIVINTKQQLKYIDDIASKRVELIKDNHVYGSITSNHTDLVYEAFYDPVYGLFEMEYETDEQK